MRPKPFGLRRRKRHSALLIAYLERLNYALRALIGAFSGATSASLKPKQTLETAVARTFMPQALDALSYTKKSLITTRVTTIFFVTLFTSISYDLNARPTAVSRIIACSDLFK